MKRDVSFIETFGFHINISWKIDSTMLVITVKQLNL